MEQMVHILLVMPHTADDEDIVIEGIRKEFENEGIPCGRLEIRSSKMLAKQYLEMYPDTNVAIVSQYQSDEGEYLPSELDELSLLGEKICLIPILSEEKGSNYVKQLEQAGIYTAVFENDSDYGFISRLVKQGRSKKEARQYYGLEGGSLDTVAGYDAQNAVRFLLGAGEDYTELANRMALLSEKLQSGGKLLEVLSNLPEKQFSLVARMEKYHDICLLVKEQQNKTHMYQAAQNPDMPDSDRKGKKTKKNCNTRLSQKEDLREFRQTIEMGVLSTNIGVGCTYSAILMAHSLQKDYKAKVAVVEFDNTDQHFENLCRMSSIERNVDGLQRFTVGEVDYFFNLTYSRFSTQLKPMYDYVIYDLGCADDKTIDTFFMELPYKFVVTGGSDWRIGELVDFMDDVAGKDIHHNFVYLVPMADTCMIGNTASILKEHLVAGIPHEKVPYMPGRSTRKLFKSLIEHKYQMPKKIREIPIEEKLKKNMILSKGKSLQGALLVTCGLAVGGIFTYYSKNGYYGGILRTYEAKYQEIEKDYQQELSRHAVTQEELGKAEDELKKSRQELQELKNQIEVQSEGTEDEVAVDA